MTFIQVTIRRFVDDWQPGFVECTFVDAHGIEHSIIEKIPVVTRRDLWSDSEYPTAGFVGCEVIERRLDATGRELVVIDTETPWRIQSTTGATRFELLPELLTDTDWARPQ
jgi:hypothetical protein